MKKFYSLAVALTAVASVWASTPGFTVNSDANRKLILKQCLAKKDAKLDLSKISGKPLELKNIKGFVKKSAQEIAKTQAKKAAPAKAISLGDYTSLGTENRMYTAELAAIGLYPETMNMRMYVHNSERRYAVANAYRNTYFGEAVTPATGYMEIDATNADKVYVKPYDICTYTINENTYTLSATSYADYAINYYKNNDGSEITFEQLYDDDTYASMFGKFEDGLITFGSTVLYLNGEPFTMTNDPNIIALPGKKFYHTLVDVSDTYTTDNDTIYAALYFGGDIKSVKMDIEPNYIDLSESNEELFKSIAESDSVTTITWSYDLTLGTHEFGNNHFPFTIIMTGLDEDGNYVQTSLKQVFYQPDESANWKTIGNGSYNEGFFREMLSIDIFGGLAMNVEYQEHKQIPGYLRIVNPYRSVSALSQYTDSINDHYLYIIALNNGNSPVCIEPSSPGVYNDYYGYSIVRSVSYDDFIEYRADNTYVPNANYAATFNKETNTIKFPANSLLTAFPYLDDGEYMIVDENAYFSAILPAGYEVAGVKDVANVIDENAPVEYFNLQGVRVDNPTPGQLVIRRQGGESTKVIVK